VILPLADLKKGMSWWLAKKKWPRDFHNEVYYELFKVRQNGLTEIWWDKTLNRLWNWGAIRPFPKSEVWQRGLEILPSLQMMYRRLLTETHPEPHFLDFKWQQLMDFYDLLADIKPSRSPVFPSKLGHFIFPNLFIVMDNEATGTQEYESYWQSMHEAWHSFDEKSLAKLILSNIIEHYSTRTVHERYPFAIKIIELCAIGRRMALTDDLKRISGTFTNSEEDSTVPKKEAGMEQPDEKSQRDIMIIWSHEKMKAYVYIAHKLFMGKNKEEVKAIWHKPWLHGSNRNRIEEFWEIVDASDYEMKVLYSQGNKDSDELKGAKKRVIDEWRRKGYDVLNKR
jgi:hypothetical protein